MAGAVDVVTVHTIGQAVNRGSLKKLFFFFVLKAIDAADDTSTIQASTVTPPTLKGLTMFDHSAYQSKVKKISSSSLRYIIQDCSEAIAANPHNPKLGQYADEIHYCAAELRKRGE